MKRSAVAMVYLLVFSGCAHMRTSAYRKIRVSPEIKILKSGIWLPREEDKITVEYRLIYRLFSSNGFTNVEISHTLNDRGGRVLARRKTTKRQRPGIYPVTLSFDMPGNALSGSEVFFVKTVIVTASNAATDTRPLTLSVTPETRPGEGEKRFDIYGYLREQIQGLSDPCPSRTIPMVREITDAAGTTEELYLECLPIDDDELNETAGEMEISYPRSGRSYAIERERYPEFYRKSDLDGDGKVTLYELATAQRTINELTGRYPEGDIDSIVREYMRMEVR